MQKPHRSQPDTKERYILRTIQEAEANPCDDLWEFATDEADFLLFLKKEISKKGKISEEIS